MIITVEGLGPRDKSLLVVNSFISVFKGNTIL